MGCDIVLEAFPFVLCVYVTVCLSVCLYFFVLGCVFSLIQGIQEECIRCDIVKKSYSQLKQVHITRHTTHTTHTQHTRMHTHYTYTLTCIHTYMHTFHILHTHTGTQMSPQKSYRILTMFVSSVEKK